MQHSEIVGRQRDIGQMGAGARNQCFVIGIAGRRRAERNERLDRAKPRRGTIVSRESVACDHDARRAILDDISRFVRREARIQRSLDEPNLVQRTFDFHQLRAVAGLNRNPVAFRKAEPEERIRQQGRAFVKLTVCQLAVSMNDRNVVAPITRGAAQKVSKAQSVSPLSMLALVCKMQAITTMRHWL